jgi:PAS domain S-box-containing protein
MKSDFVDEFDNSSENSSASWSEAVVELDGDGRVMSVSNLDTMSGFPFLSMNPGEMLVPPTLVGLMASWEQALRDAGVGRVGRWHWVEARAVKSAKRLEIALHRMGKDRIVAVLRSWRDFAISVEDLGLNPSVVETLQETFLLLGPPGIIAYINRAGANRLGYEPEEMIGQPVAMMDVAEDAAASLRRVQEIIQRGHGEFSVVNRHKSGTLHPGRVVAQCIQHQGIPWIVASCRDVSGQLVGERNEAWLHALVASSPDPVCLRDTAMRCIMANSLFLAMLGLPPDTNVQGRSLAEIQESALSGRGYDGEKADQLAMGLPRGGCHENETVVTDANGVLRALHWKRFPVHQSDGVLLGTACVAHDITRMTQSERLVREQEQLFHQLFENLPEAAFLVRWDGREVAVVSEINRAFSEMTGWTGRQLSGQLCRAIVTEVGAGGGLELFWQTVLDRGEGSYFCNLRLRTGGEMPVKLNGISVKNSSQTGHGLLVFAKDRRLAREEERDGRVAHEILECIPLPLFFKDSYGRYLRCNRAFAEWLGVPVSKILGKTVRELGVTEAVAQLLAQQDAELLDEAGGPQIYQATMYRSNGSEQEVIVHKAPLSIGEAQIKGIVGVVMDISLLRELGQALALGENQYRQVFFNVSDAIFVVDGISGIIQDVNPAAESLYLTARRELIGKMFRELEISEVEVGETLRSSTLWHRRGSGEIFAVEVDQAVIHTKERPIWVYTVRDVDQREQKESTLLKAKEQAESAARMKSDFLNLASHELRSPLTPILGMSELLLEEKLAPEVHGKIQMVHDAAQHLTHLIRNILDVARIGAGKTTIENGLVQLPYELKHLAEQFRVSAEKKGLFLHAEQVELLPKWIVSDAGRLRQIVSHLLSNAVKFTISGGIVLRAAVEPRKEGHPDLLKIAVIDSGPGIPQEKRELIFEPFFQADNSVTRRHGGAGLGLTIARQLARLMRGDLTVETSETGGCQFNLVVGVELLAPAQALPSAVPPRDVTSAVTALHGKKILVAEHEPITAATLLNQLESLGAQTVLVGSSEDALRHLVSHQVDGMLFNMKLPHLSGTALVEKILEAIGGKRRPTMVGLVSDSGQEKPAGVSLLLSYPIRLCDLVRAFSSDFVD